MTKLHSKEDEEFLARIAKEAEEAEIEAMDEAIAEPKYEGEDFTLIFTENPDAVVETPLGKIYNNIGGGGNKRVRLKLMGYEGEETLPTVYRIIYENYYGCKIPKGCDIHHKDGNPFNCHISNLVLIDHGLHTKFHAMERKIENFEHEREALVEEIKALKDFIRTIGEDLYNSSRL